MKIDKSFPNNQKGNITEASSPVIKNHTPNNLPIVLINAIQKIYLPTGLKITQPASREPESAEYSACRLELNGHQILFRTAKTTPTKIGQFVTIWKRVKGKTAPLNVNDNIEFAIIHVADKRNHGQFIFDQNALIKHGILSVGSKLGKMAFRVYPPWVKPLAKNAIKSQQWQIEYFLRISEDGSADANRARELFKL